VRRLEVVPLDAAMARIHARLWRQLSDTGLMIGPHDLIVAATATHRHWSVVTFNAAEFRHIRGLVVIEP
jgi:tRNA(fMet)-specific endonuclease VapC